nr:MAG TPA: Baseplate structural protein [Caudoviricetes sp.]
MPMPSNPPFLSNVLGYAADVSVIPGTTPSGSGAFSYQSAFPQITAIPLTAGGVAPMREDFNAVFKLLSQHVHFLQSGSLYTWSNALDYLKGAHILGSNGVEYIAQASSGPNVPDVGAKNPVSDDGTHWRAVNSGNDAGAVPIGGILPFSGTFGGTGSRFPIPLGSSEPLLSFCLCDGTTTNGLPVPDLRGLFIRGASDAHPAGSTGGSEKHSHSLSGTVGATTLTVAQLASHAHGIQLRGGSRDCGYASGSPQFWVNWYDGATATTGGSQAHTHSLTGAKSGSASSLPPYYALAYIMRTA